MNDKFFDLKKEKQDKIINGALKVFAQDGYAHASTDRIVTEAGISKGLLFHYFGSKTGLFEFLYGYCIRYFIMELRSSVPVRESNFFEIKKRIEYAKMQTMRSHPFLVLFLEKAEEESHPEALPVIKEKSKLLREEFELINVHIAYRHMPSYVDISKLENMLDMAAKGLLHRELRKDDFKPEEYYWEVEAYLDMMKQLIKLNADE